MKTNKKIIFIIPLKGSFDTFLKELALYLIKNDWCVHVVCNTPNKKSLTENNIRYIHCPIPRGAKPIQMLKASNKLREIITKINPCIIHAHFQTAILAYQLTRLVGKYKSFATIHGAVFNSIENKQKKWFFKNIEKFSFRKFIKVFVLNQKDLDEVSKISSNVEKYPCNGVGCDIEKFDPKNFTSKDLDDLRKQYNLTENNFIIIFIGRFVHFKGFQRVIQTFRALEKKHSHLRLLLLGKSDELHPSGLNLEEEEYYKTNPNIIKVGYTEEVAKHLAISNLTFFPSIKEGLPVNLMESISMLVPIVTQGSRGCEDLVREKEIGIVIDSLNIKDYVITIEKLIESSNTLLKYKENMERHRSSVDRKNFILHEFNLYEQQIK